MGDLSFSVLVASDYPRIVTFLSQPEVDEMFVLPLSQRAESIDQKVVRISRSGVWVVVLVGERIIGCRAIDFDPAVKIATFCTFVVHPDFQSRGIGTELMRFSIEVARQRFNPCVIRYDSWSTNKPSTALATRFEFVKVAEYDDPERRPPGTRTVVYEKHYQRVEV